MSTILYEDRITGSIIDMNEPCPNILNGEQLVRTSSKTSHELPAGGLKEFQPTNSWLEQKQIQSALDQRKCLLEEERVEKSNCLMRAEWMPEHQKAVVKQKSKAWEVFGHHCDNNDWLFPEEALFLLEMNSLECTFNEVPVSIQKGYSIFLGEERGCTTAEYKVFSHLSRSGYRVVRHLPNLTVTAYEKKIRLDCHLEQKTTYEKPAVETKSKLESIKKINNLHDKPCLEEENIEKHDSSENQSNAPDIEVIDLLDSSQSDTSSDESSDSEIEVVFETVPRSKPGVTEVTDSDEGSEIDIIEVPVPPKHIEVATIESSSEEESSDSESAKSCDGNWKRSKSNLIFNRPSSMSHFTYLSIEEFCKEVGHNNNENKDKGQTSNSSSGLTKSLYPVGKTRISILDSMPSMAGQNQKLMTVECPDLRLIPDNAIPKHQTYTFNTNSLRARIYNPSKFALRGRRNFYGSRFNNNMPYSQNACLFQHPSNTMVQGNQMPQIFGSDVQSMARNMMQIASALLLNSPTSNMNNTYNILNRQSQPNAGFAPERFNRNCSNQWFSGGHNRFPRGVIDHSLPHQSAQSENFQYFTNAPINNSQARFNVRDTDRRNFSPSEQNMSLSYPRNQGKKFSNRNKLYSNKMLLSPSTSQTVSDNTSFPDPAYLKSDVPLQTTENKSTVDFISLSSPKQIEIVEVDDKSSVKKTSGVSTRFNKRKKRQKKNVAKKFCHNKSKSPEFIFLDSPHFGDSSLERTPEHQEEQIIKSEPNASDSNQTFDIKTENNVESVKNENDLEDISEPRVKSEDRNGIKVRLDQSGANILVEIKIENQIDTSVVSTLPLDTIFKSELVSVVKSESESKGFCTNLKVEQKDSVDTTQVSTAVKEEDPVKLVKRESSFEESEEVKQSCGNSPAKVIQETNFTKENTIDQEDVCGMECDSTTDISLPPANNPQVPVDNQSSQALDHSIQNIDSNINICVVTDCNKQDDKMVTDAIDSSLVPINEENMSDERPKPISSWAEMKNTNFGSYSSEKEQLEGTSDEDGEDEYRPLMRLEHCKSIETVQSRLQIFEHFNPDLPEDLPNLKISFDMYLPADFRKSQRGLPYFRISVFEGSEEMPNSAQLHELQHRFSDEVKTLCAVVMPSSVLFYSCSDISLPVDLTSYTSH